jgi:hypothetical protein
MNKDTKTDLERKEAEFLRQMLESNEIARREFGYIPTRFNNMMLEYGALDTAHRLLAKTEISEGLVTLFEAGRPDLSLEAHVLKAEFADLFTEDELQTARARLGLE